MPIFNLYIHLIFFIYYLIQFNHPHIAYFTIYKKKSAKKQVHVLGLNPLQGSIRVPVSLFYGMWCPAYDSPKVDLFFLIKIEAVQSVTG